MESVDAGVGELAGGLVRAPDVHGQNVGAHSLEDQFNRVFVASGDEVCGFRDSVVRHYSK